MFIIKYILLLYFIYFRETLAGIHTEIDILNDEYTKIENLIFEDKKEMDKSIINMAVEFGRKRILPLSKNMFHPNFTKGIQENIDGIHKEYIKFLEQLGYFHKSKINLTNDAIALLQIMISKETDAAQKRMDKMNSVSTVSYFNIFQNSTTAKGIKNNIEIIENSYNTLKKYINMTLNNKNIMPQLKDITSKAVKISGTRMEKIYSEMDKNREEMLKILQRTNSSGDITSTQQLLFDILALAQFKCYLMARFKYFLDDRYEDNLMPLVKLKRQFKMIFNETVLKTHIRRCDPVRFVRNQNYIQFTRVLQGFIPSFDKFPDNCQGKTVSCMNIYSTGRVCTSSFPHRKYDYIEQGNGPRLGKLQYCQKSSIKPMRPQNNQLICLCDQQGGPSDRYISLRRVFSDVSSNRVITGVKFIKLNRVLHLQAQEGKLLPEGHIEQETVHWIPIETFNITDIGVDPYKDYFLLTNKSRTIVMGEIQGEEDNNDYVLTGIGLRYIDEKIQLNIQLTQSNWETGKLNITKNKNLSNKEITRSFTPYNADIPTYTNKTSQLWNATPWGPWAIRFVNTDFEKDAAQTTVPFLDAQEVISIPAMPLIGAGLYYKSSPGYGGFIAPVIKHYDFLKRGDRMDGLN